MLIYVHALCFIFNASTKDQKLHIHCRFQERQSHLTVKALNMFFSIMKNYKHVPVGYMMCVAISDVR